MCPLKAVVDLSFCECLVFGSCKKKVSFRIFIFVEFVSGFACVGPVHSPAAGPDFYEFFWKLDSRET